MQPEARPPKGVLAKVLRAIGIPPTEETLFNARLTIVILGLLIIGYSFFTYDDVGKKYGNYDEIKHKLPK